MESTDSQANESNPNQKRDPQQRESVRDSLITHGWRQGSLLPPELVANLAAQDLLPAESSDLDFIIVSHTCDVIHESLENEPSVEVLVVRKIEQLEGNFSRGKNPRRIHFEFEGATYEGVIHKRISLPREILLGSTPRVTLPPSLCKLLGRWISKRYSRAAFPNAFEDRIRKAHGDFQKILSPASKHISGIYLLIEDAELPGDQEYEISIFATVPEPQAGNPLLMAKAAEALARLATRMNECDGINVFETDALSTRDLSLHSLEELKRWDYDTLSFRESPEGPIAPQE